MFLFLGIRQIWIQNCFHHFISCVTLGVLLNLSELFSFSVKQGIMSPLTGL